MNAQEARARVEQAIQADEQEQHRKIYKAIEDAVANKKLEITWHEELYPYVRTCLIDDQYKIGAGLYFDGRMNEQEYSITIKW